MKDLPQGTIQKKRTHTEVHLCEFAIEVVQQYAQLNKGRQAHYWTAGLSVIESAFWLLYEYKVIKDPKKVRITEIKSFNKHPYEIPPRRDPETNK